MAIYQLGDDTPELHDTAWVADSASVIGKVHLGEQSSVWYGTVVRGDTDHIRIGARSNVQDGSVLHTDAGIELVIEEDVTVGHQVTLHGCHIGRGSLIGIGATVLNRASIGAQCVVGAGSLVTEGKHFPDRSLIMGVPAKVVRTLSAEEAEQFGRGAAQYVDNAQLHARQLHRIR